MAANTRIGGASRETRAMVLSPEEARVVACLVEKEATVPDSYPLTLNALRLACNQSTNRDPIVAYDDRTVENALMSLKSMGLVRFVHPSHGGRTIRYRHVADERWHLSTAELGVLAVLVLRGAADRRRGPLAAPVGLDGETADGRRAPRHAGRPQPGAVRRPPASDGPASARAAGPTPCRGCPTRTRSTTPIRVDDPRAGARRRSPRPRRRHRPGPGRRRAVAARRAPGAAARAGGGPQLVVADVPSASAVSPASASAPRSTRSSERLFMQ